MKQEDKEFLDSIAVEKSLTEAMVTIPRELLIRFKNSYMILLRQLALIYGVEYKELCPLDLMGDFLREEINKDQPSGIIKEG